MAETVINEKASFWITAACFDRNSSGTTPTAFTWQVYDSIDGTKLTSGSETPSTSMLVSIASTANAIRHARPYERRRFNCLATFSGGGQLPEEMTWLVKNLKFTSNT